MKKWILLALAMTVSAQAKVFKITCTGGCVQAVATEMENQINAELPDADASTYLQGMANASAASGKAIGSDYSNDLDFMMVSANVGVGLDTGNKDLSDFIGGDVEENQVRGVGINAALTIGLDLGILPVDKLGPIDLEKTDLFLSFMKYDNGDAGVDDVAAEMKYMSIKARYHWKEGKAILPGGLLKWGGVFITTGIEKSSLRMELKEDISDSATVGGQTISASGTARFGADISTTSIPIEISTYIQTLYALTFFGGLGADYNMGEAKSIANASVNFSGSGAGGAGDTVGTLDLGQKGEPESTTFRGFLGLQVGVPLVKFYVQMNKQFTGDNVGQVAAGLKVIW